MVSASGDGGLQVWDVSRPSVAPLSLREHKKEVYSVDWTRTRQEQHILSASWDCSVKLVCFLISILLSSFISYCIEPKILHDVLGAIVKFLHNFYIILWIIANVLTSSIIDK